MDDRSFVAAQDFILEVKCYWTTVIYPQLKGDFEERARAMDPAPDTPDAVANVIGDTILYQYYAWLERHLQRFKYSGRYGLYPYHHERRDALLASLGDDRRVVVDPGLELPQYYRDVDIHQHPGGVWSDEIAGFVYERGARSTTPLMSAGHEDLHQRLTDFAAATGPAPTRLLDMGCGFGKSTRPLYETFKEAEVEAIDLSEPCVRLGALDAASSNSRVHFRQMDAMDTSYDDGTFDLVTSTMLMHELPPPTIDQLFDEAMRLLQPGGRMVHLDFHFLPDAFARFIHYGHGRRNNEPFMESWAEMNLAQILKKKGLVNVQVIPFKEVEGADRGDYPYWRFPWTIIYAEKQVGES
ncbi:MAG: class I SAM-dependent methyltransferase [Pseudomonadota bacterium]|nr:class I SAM-dependent methyltransferase [Pseudomonadota bacterium]